MHDDVTYPLGNLTITYGVDESGELTYSVNVTGDLGYVQAVGLLAAAQLDIPEIYEVEDEDF